MNKFYFIATLTFLVSAQIFASEQVAQPITKREELFQKLPAYIRDEKAFSKGWRILGYSPAKRQHILEKDTLSANIESAGEYAKVLDAEQLVAFRAAHKTLQEEIQKILTMESDASYAANKPIRFDIFTQQASPITEVQRNLDMLYKRELVIQNLITQLDVVSEANKAYLISFLAPGGSADQHPDQFSKTKLVPVLSDLKSKFIDDLSAISAYIEFELGEFRQNRLGAFDQDLGTVEPYGAHPSIRELRNRILSDISVEDKRALANLQSKLAYWYTALHFRIAEAAEKLSVDQADNNRRHQNLAIYQIHRFTLETLNLRTVSLVKRIANEKDEMQKHLLAKELENVDQKYNGALLLLQEFDLSETAAFHGGYPYPGGQVGWFSVRGWFEFVAKSYNQLDPLGYWHPSLEELVFERQLALNGMDSMAEAYKALFHQAASFGPALWERVWGGILRDDHEFDERVKLAIGSLKDLAGSSPRQFKLIWMSLVRTKNELETSPVFSNSVVAAAGGMLSARTTENVLDDILSTRPIESIPKLSPALIALIHFTSYLPYATGGVQAVIGGNFVGFAARSVAWPIRFMLGWNASKTKSHLTTKIPIEGEIAANAILQSLKSLDGGIIQGVKDVSSYVVMRAALKAGGSIVHDLLRDVSDEQRYEENCVRFNHGRVDQKYCLKIYSMVANTPCLDYVSLACSLVPDDLRFAFVPLIGSQVVRLLPSIAGIHDSPDVRDQIQKIHFKHAMRKALEPKAGKENVLSRFVDSNATVVATNLGLDPSETRKEIKEMLLSLIDALNDDQSRLLGQVPAMFEKILIEATEMALSAKKAAIEENVKLNNKDLIANETELLASTKSFISSKLDAVLAKTDGKGNLVAWTQPEKVRERLIGQAQDLN